MKSSLKRNHGSSQYNDLDLENIDPVNFLSPSKKNKTGSQNFVPQLKVSKFNLTSVSRPMNAMKSSSNSVIPIETPTAPGSLKRKATDTITPDEVNSSKQRHVDSTPAGRSPKSKRIGILSRRRMASSPFTRINPPVFAGAETSGDMPFSIDAALSGTVPTNTKKATVSQESLDGSLPKGWMFDIYEETVEQQSNTELAQSTEILVISDDERYTDDKDSRGKENIPPTDGINTLAPVTTAVPASRKNMMTDEPRTPLGDLNAGEFYAEGCDENSFFIIPAENSEESDIGKPLPPFQLDDTLKNLIAQAKQVNSTATVTEASSTYLVKDESHDCPSTVDIWESESAKAEDEALNQEAFISVSALTSNDEEL